MTDSAIKYVGVDGCKGGWVGVGLSAGDCWDVKVCVDFSDMLEHFGDACVILVDMPIGLPEDGKLGFRACDCKARKILKPSKRENSVFRVPSKRFVKAAMENPEWGFDVVGDVKNRYGRAKEELNCRFHAPGSFGSQEFYMVPKINEVEKALSPGGQTVSLKVREAHPEVCFWALNKALKEERQLVSKHESLGFGQRLRIVQCWVPNAVEIFEKVPSRESKTDPKVAPNDVLDALALAITAQFGSQNGFERLPENLSTDRKKPPEMVYALIQ